MTQGVMKINFNGSFYRLLGMVVCALIIFLVKRIEMRQSVSL